MSKILKLLANCKDGWRTTLIGSLIITASILSVFLLEYSWLTVTPGLAIGTVLFVNKN